MELEDLVLKHYRLMRDGECMVVVEDENGLYEAESADALLRFYRGNGRVDKYSNLRVRHKVGGTWYRLGHLRE